MASDLNDSITRLWGPIQASERPIIISDEKW